MTIEEISRFALIVFAGLKAILDIIFATVFAAIAIKTIWEIRRHHLNGVMFNIKRLSISSSMNYLAMTLLLVNGIFRTTPGYPVVITPILLFFDLITAIWLGINMYKLAYIIINEEVPDERLDHLPPVETTS